MAIKFVELMISQKEFFGFNLSSLYFSTRKKADLILNCSKLDNLFIRSIDILLSFSWGQGRSPILHAF